MKKILVALTLALTLIVASTSQTASAQAFAGKGSKTLMFGLGGSYYFGLGNANNNAYYYGRHFGLAAPIISMDFGVHQYVSVGFWIAPNHSFGYGYFGLGNSGYYALAIPGMVRADFHFYQLIDDKSASNIHSDQLDIYAGLSLGGGPAFIIRPSGGGIYGVFGVGPQVGIRWYPGAGNVGIYAEASPYIGKSFLEVGCAIKL